MPFAATSMDLELVMLSETKSDGEGEIHHDLHAESTKKLYK